MYYILEAILWFILSYYWSKYVSSRSILLIGAIAFPCVAFIDPLLYKWGFILTASTVYISILIGIPSYSAWILGVLLSHHGRSK